MLEELFSRDHLGLHLNSAQVDLLNERHCLYYKPSPPIMAPGPSLAPLPCDRKPTCRLTSYSAGALHTGSGWHQVLLSAPPQPPTPLIGSTF